MKTEILLIIMIVLCAALAGALIALALSRKGKGESKDLDEKFRAQNELTLKMMSGMNSSHKADTEAMRSSVDNRLRMIQQDNAKRLEEIRHTVDERLRSSVSAGIEGSFKTVSGQLDAVSRSIGELKGMGTDIVDLKKVLGGVKQRGNWGEAQLDAILSDMLPPEGYFSQYSVDGSREKVDFAIKLPGEGCVLPVDSKFPMGRYEQVLRAYESADASMQKAADDALKRAVFEQARSIRKYIAPPATTDFAVMFIPSEAIFSHVCSLGISGEIMRSYGIIAAGPSTMAALVSTVDMGCVKFAVEEKSAEILSLLKESKKQLEKLSQSAALAERNAQLTVQHICEMKKTADKIADAISSADR